jgi:FHA domain
VSAPTSSALPPGSKAKLSVVKGLRVGKTYALMEGVTYVGRKGPQEINVDLTEQENPGVAVAVNRFALIWLDKNGLGIADTGTRAGTTLNGVRIPPKKRFPLKAEDTLQWGKTVLQVKVILKKGTGVQK